MVMTANNTATKGIKVCDLIMERGKQTPRFSACPAIPIPDCRDLPLVPDSQPAALAPSPRHPQGATSCWIVVECREQDAEEVVTMTKTAMLDGMKQLAKDCPVEVEGVIGKTWGSTK